MTSLSERSLNSREGLHRQGSAPMEDVFPGALRLLAQAEDFAECRLQNGVTAYLLPHFRVCWTKFRRLSPRCSIALDGLVPGPTHWGDETLRMTLDHHERVDRASTRSTCAQVLYAIQNGFLDDFVEHGQPTIRVWSRDIDEDNCMAWWLLEQRERVARSTEKPRIERLVALEDLLDASAGTFKVDPDSLLMRQCAWVFEPYRSARRTGALFGMDAAQMVGIYREVADRLDLYARNRPQEIDVDSRFEVLGDGPFPLPNGASERRWAMIREIGNYARNDLLNSGIHAFLSVVPRPSGNYTCTLAKLSPTIPFPILDLYWIFNRLEGLPDRGANCWGGNEMVGGSPLRTGTSLTPEQLQLITSEYLRFSKGRSQSRAQRNRFLAAYRRGGTR